MPSRLAGGRRACSGTRPMGSGRCAPNWPSARSTCSRRCHRAAPSPALMIDRQPERDLPAQIPRHALHRLLIRDAGAVLQQQHPGQLRRRDRRPPHPRRITRREVFVAHDPMPMLGQQREERPLRQRPSKLSRIKEPDLARHHREHAQQRHKPTGRSRDYFSRLLGGPPPDSAHLGGVYGRRGSGHGEAAARGVGNDEK